MVKHWLYKELSFPSGDLEKETNCGECIHCPVCDHDKTKRCENFRFGRSDETGCNSCSNHYARYDRRQPIPCFSCQYFQTGKPKVPKKDDMEDHIGVGE